MFLSAGLLIIFNLAGQEMPKIQQLCMVLKPSMRLPFTLKIILTGNMDGLAARAPWIKFAQTCIPAPDDCAHRMVSETRQPIYGLQAYSEILLHHRV